MSLNDSQADDEFNPDVAPETGLCSYPIEEEIKQQAIDFADGFGTPGSYHANSIIITGPSGAGKRDFARRLVGELRKRGLHQHQWVRKLDPDLASDPDGVPTIFDKARAHEPLTVVFDIADMLRRDSQALSVKSELRKTWQQDHDIAVVFVIDEGHLWNEAVDLIFKGADRAIDLPAPTRSRRRSLLEHELHQIVEKNVCAVGDDEFDVGPTAIKSEGFAVDEVRNVVHRAVEAVQNGNEDELTSDLLSQTAEKLQGERHEELQSEAAAGLFDAPKTTFEDIGGLKRAKQEIRKAVQKPDAWETAYEQWDVSPGKNILLYGPPGTGKTMLARAAANETDRAFMPVNAADVKTGMDELFTHARRNAPSLVFFDEFDSIGGQRGHINHTSDDVVNSLLSELDGLGAEADVVVIAATNRPEVLDPALLRPGRFGEHIEVDDPDDEALHEIVRLHTAEVPTAEDLTTDWFVGSVDVDTGAEIKSICDRAVENALAAADTDDPTAVTVTRDAVLRAADQLATDRVEHSESAPPEPTFQ